MDMVSAIKTATTLSQFVKEDLPRALSGCDLRAAESALLNIDLAKDKRSVYWSAINHLESAESKLEPRSGVYDDYHKAINLIYLCSIRAIVLKHLDEHLLVAKCGERCVKISQEHNENIRMGGTQIMLIARSWNVFDWFKTKYIGDSAKFDYVSFWSYLGFNVERVQFFDPDPSPHYG